MELKLKSRNRCTGHCCECFTLPVGPDELWSGYNRWVRFNSNTGDYVQNIEKNRTDFPVRRIGPMYTDIHLIAPMVIYLGHKKIPYKETIPELSIIKKHHLYKCKHFDNKKRICTIYEFRPQMCRDYPGSRGCNYAACTWRHHKRLKKTNKKIMEERKANE